MKQLTQQLKSGHMEIIEVPFPALNAGQILVRNHYSVISSGTEGKTVSDARKGYIAKARSRQKEVEQVIKLAKTQGLKETYNMVMNKLDAPSALGYSTSGEVIAVAGDVTNFSVGDKVACGGATASHADVVAIPQNLCVKLPENADMQQAAFTTIAAIAMQGIRQASVKIGENVVVIGLGLIGQIAISLLSAAGIKAIGVDLDEAKVQQAKQSGAVAAYTRNQAGIDNIIADLTNGHGTDAVIITAGTSSHDPVNFAGEIARPKAKVVIVGAVPTGFERKNYYRKELELLMSCSYGPGRYDLNYEEKGIDYPIGHVRWTENRNMQAFANMLTQNKINISHLISHNFKLEDAKKAYDLIINKKESFTGITIQYNTQAELKQKIVLSNTVHTPAEPNIGLIGAGSFAQNMLLPRMKGLFNFVGIATARGNSSSFTGKKYGFNYCTNNTHDLFADESINTIFITTRHNQHAAQIVKALQYNKNVFTEKPLCLAEEELEEIKAAYNNSHSKLMLGFNRRFSPLTQKINSVFTKDQKKSINIRINAGILPAGHWVHDPQIGGGRIIGETCHFIDLAAYLAQSNIKSVYATGIETNNTLHDTVNINLTFENGSIANIAYYSNGSKELPKEYIEVFSAGTSCIIDDFKQLTIYNNKKQKIKLKEQDKGHKQQLIEFSESIKQGIPSPISFDELYNSTLATFNVLKSIQSGRKYFLTDTTYHED